MAPTASDIARLRRMVDEPTTATYSNELLTAYLEGWQTTDSEGRSSDETDYVSTYDLHASAAELWEEKAAAVHAKHDFSADGATYSSDQMYQNCMEQARYHAARAKMRTRISVVRPIDNTGLESFIINIGQSEDEDDPNIWRTL